MQTKTKKWKWIHRASGLMYLAFVMLALPVVTSAAPMIQAVAPIAITEDSTTALPLGRIIAGVSITIAGIMWAGSALFGSDWEEKAKRGVLAAIAGMVLLSIGSILVGAI